MSSSAMRLRRKRPRGIEGEVVCRIALPLDVWRLVLDMCDLDTLLRRVRKVCKRFWRLAMEIMVDRSGRYGCSPHWRCEGVRSYQAMVATLRKAAVTTPNKIPRSFTLSGYAGLIKHLDLDARASSVRGDMQMLRLATGLERLVVRNHWVCNRTRSVLSAASREIFSSLVHLTSLVVFGTHSRGFHLVDQGGLFSNIPAAKLKDLTFAPRCFRTETSWRITEMTALERLELFDTAYSDSVPPLTNLVRLTSLSFCAPMCHHAHPSSPSDNVGDKGLGCSCWADDQLRFVSRLDSLRVLSLDIGWKEWRVPRTPSYLDNVPTSLTRLSLNVVSSGASGVWIGLKSSMPRLRELDLSFPIMSDNNPFCLDRSISGDPFPSLATLRLWFRNSSVSEPRRKGVIDFVSGSACRVSTLELESLDTFGVFHLCTEFTGARCISVAINHCSSLSRRPSARYEANEFVVSSHTRMTSLVSVSLVDPENGQTVMRASRLPMAQEWKIDWS